MANEPIVSKASGKSPSAEFAGLLERMKPELAAALPKHINADRMARLAMTSFRTVRNLDKCDMRSILACIVTASQLGLEIGVNGQAWLIPFRKGRGTDARYECQLIPGYQGLIDLMYRSGLVESVYAEPVYALDQFNISLGIDRTIIHFPNLEAENRGELRLVYAVAKLKSGAFIFDWMTKAEVDAIRRRSKSGDDGPWVTDYVPMALKTVIRRMSKKAPKSVEMHNALVLDSASQYGLQQKLTFEGAKLITSEPMPDLPLDPPENDEQEGDALKSQTVVLPDGALLDKATGEIHPPAQAQAAAPESAQGPRPEPEFIPAHPDQQREAPAQRVRHTGTLD